jgi:hypothetical protein
MCCGAGKPVFGVIGIVEAALAGPGKILPDTVCRDVPKVRFPITT